jgi:hypothetical protein
MSHTGAVHSTENSLAKVKNTFIALFLRNLDNNFFLLHTSSFLFNEEYDYIITVYKAFEGVA